MKLITLKCPNCGSSLEIENGIDIFFCKYCGHKIMLAEQSPEAIHAKVSIKGMEHEENLADKKYEHERYKIKAKSDDNKEAMKTMLIFMGMVILLCLVIHLTS